MPEFSFSLTDGNPDELAKMSKTLNWLMANLDHLNVKSLFTEYCKIQSENGETVIDGPLIEMNAGTSTVRLKIGKEGEDFVFKLYNIAGEETISLDSNGDVIVSGIYTGTLTAAQINAVEIVTLAITGTLNCGNTLEIGPPNASGGQCHINTGTDALRLQAHVAGNYLAYFDDGSLEFFVNDVGIATLRADGTTDFKPDPVEVTSIVYKADGTGFDTDLDGSQDSWTWTKDGSGRITKLESSGGRVVNVTY